MTDYKYKIGDLVYCRDSEELEQPMVVDGYNKWFTDVPVYYVKAKHKKRGNELVVTLTEGILKETPE